MISVRLSVDNS